MNTSGNPIFLADVSTLTNGLMAYWKLDESSGNAVDASGNGITGTSSNISYASGKINNCYTFNGSSSKVAFGNVVKPTSAISFSGWYKSSSSSKDNTMIDCIGYTANFQGYSFGVNTSNQVLIYLGNNTANFLDFETNPSGAVVTINDGNWHWIAGTWDGSNVYLYLDSYKSGASTWAYTLSYSASNSLNMGFYNYGTLWATASFDEVGIWNRVLTTSELSTLYNSGSGKQYPFS